MRGYLAASGSAQGGWDLLSHALPVAFNSRTNVMFTCVCSPEAHFKFHSSVIRSQSSHGVFESLFCRSVSMLQPMLQLPDIDTSNPQGVAVIELALGSSLFDAMAHLVALSSLSLHDIIENHVRPSAVQHRVESVESGMNASVSSEGLFVGRVEEIGKINRCMGPVFQGGEEHCVLALVHGIPGTGKSRLAKRQLELLQRESSPHVVYRHIVQGRGRGAVRDGLHQMGLALAVQLNVGIAASVDDVLPRLTEYLKSHRFVILADDADSEALDELLKHVPKSSEPCALVLTSQFGLQIKRDILQRLHSKHLPFKFSLASDSNISLDTFDSETAVELVGRMCIADKYDIFRKLDQDCDVSDAYTSAPPPLAQADRKFCFFWSIRSWLRGVLKRDMDYLPLAVQAFSVWLRQEVERPEANAASMMRRWSIELDDDFVGEVSSGHRAINATVRLALHNIGSQFSELDEACRQLLGLLALCPPVKVPWSLFDGVSHVSAAGQACRVRREEGSGGAGFDDAEIVSDAVESSKVAVKLSDGQEMSVACSRVEFGPHILGMAVKEGRYQVQLLTPQPYMRGTVVEVTGDPVDVVCPTGEPCQFRQTNADDEEVVHHAVVASDEIINGGESVRVQLPDGATVDVATSSVSFGPHVAAMAIEEGRFVLQLQQVHCAGGHVNITIGKQAQLVSNYICDHRVQNSVRVVLCHGQDAQEFLLPWKHAVPPEHVRVVGSQLVLHPAASARPSIAPKTTGRVLKYHRADALKRDPANDTVSVVFSCESGACLLRAPRARPHLLCA